MIPMAPGFFKPFGSPAWPYFGSLVSLSVWNLPSPETSTYNPNTSTADKAKYYDSIDPSNGIVEFTSATGPIDYDYTDSSNDIIVPFSFNSSTYIRVEAYENDVQNDFTSLNFQLLDANDDLIFTFVCGGNAPLNDLGHLCSYRVGTGSTVNISNTGLYPQLHMDISFDGTTVTGTRDSWQTDNYVNSFTATGVDLSSATKLRVYGCRAYMSHGLRTTFGNIYYVASRIAYFPDGY